MAQITTGKQVFEILETNVLSFCISFIWWY